MGAFGWDGRSVETVETRAVGRTMVVGCKRQIDGQGGAEKQFHCLYR